MIRSSGTTRRTSNRIRKKRRTYSPSTDNDTSLSMIPHRHRVEFKKNFASIVMKKKAIIPANVCSCELSISSNSSLPSQAVNDKECDNIALNHNSFWNFATTLSHPIIRGKIANDKAIPLVLNEVSSAVRQLICGAKLLMQQAKRQKLLCDDLNTLIEMKSGKSLFGFVEDNKWQKIGDVFVPNDEIIDLRFCSASVQLKTIGARFSIKKKKKTKLFDHENTIAKDMRFSKIGRSAKKSNFSIMPSTEEEFRTTQGFLI
ncbi:hypothetical protein X798_02097 [Onchocerca flexuosa]|uniref:Uncharacterized protein n=1 Tax=Onchocerca flexuosa TaxID=387005 RepID=A0A238C0H0_9BILA|nr:hypothetical protein X798_02097 [Onchocerca flexuosa]